MPLCNCPASPMRNLSPSLREQVRAICGVDDAVAIDISGALDANAIEPHSHCRNSVARSAVIGCVRIEWLREDPPSFLALCNHSFR